MKQRILMVLLLTMIITETLILYNQNQELKIKNNNIEKELQENNLIVNNVVTLEMVKKEKKALEDYTTKVFKEESIEDVFNKNKNKNEKLLSEVSILEKKSSNLEDNISTLNTEYNKLLKEYEKKNTYYITGFPFINQYPDYPTGCESVAITMLLNYYGVLVTPDSIISKLPKGPTPYTKNGTTYGGNPEVEFVGNPYSMNSFGVYEKPIAEVANHYKSGIKIATGTSFDKILEKVSTGTPVMVWTSMNLATPYISTSWIHKETGKKVYWKRNEHAVVIIGYTPDKVIIADPIGGKIKYQSKSIFRERYNYYGKKALYY